MTVAKRYRILSSKSQKDLANALKMSINAYARRERNNEMFTVGECITFCKLVGCEVDQFILDIVQQMYSFVEKK